jgi:glycosyltransferase involved in cell wall biosynthesis
MNNHRSTVREFSSIDLWSAPVQSELLQLPTDQAIAIFFSGEEKLFPGILITLKERFAKLYFGLRLTRAVNLNQFVEHAPHWILERLHLEPQQFQTSDPQTLTCAETRKTVQRLIEKGAKVSPLPYRDYRPSPNRPVAQLQWQAGLATDAQIAIVIPTRNNSAFLLNVLRHLLLQDVGSESLEVIVIDDGGNDDSLAKIKALLGPISAHFHFKYLFLPRPHEDETKFRAGHCRNLGIAHSKAPLVLFLDSDMLLPQDFASQLLVQFHNADVIQVPRLHIRPERSSIKTDIGSLAGSDTYLEEPKYWGPFFASENWPQIPFAWRYTCTYALAVRRSLLDATGGFREVFESYGFEDTELGYRLYKAGARLLLWKKTAYHLTLPKEKSRYFHSVMMKQVLLAKTAKIFFLSTLDLEVYHLFRFYMGGEPRWRQLLYARRTR